MTADELVAGRDALERDVRSSLGIPFNPSRSAMRYEHSMGQFGAGLPSHILRATEGASSPLA